MMNGKQFEVSAPDPYTVVIKTPTPNAIAAMRRSRAVRIMPKHVLEPAFKSGISRRPTTSARRPISSSPAGRGASTSTSPGEKTVLGRNPYWFGVDQENQRLPYLDELVFLVVPDQDAADLKFRSGELDGLDNVKPENYRLVRGESAEGQLHAPRPRARRSTRNFFWFNLNKVQKPTPGKKLGEPFVDPVEVRWFSNPVFRRAVSMAIDRDAMIPSIFFGDGA